MGGLGVPELVIVLIIWVIQGTIGAMKQDLENRQRCSDRYAEVKGNIEQVIQSKSKKTKKKASK